jgi:hypothetical protein
MLKPNVEAWVWAFVDNSFAYRLADSESFRAAPQHAAAFPGRKAIKNGVPVLADELRREFREKYQSQPAFLACDGGTLNRQTLLNFALKVVGRPPIYVCSRRVRDTTAATIAANIAAVRGLVVTSLGVIPVGCATDNASAMVAALSGCELEAMDDEEAEDEKETDEAPPALFLEREENPPNEDDALNAQGLCTEPDETSNTKSNSDSVGDTARDFLHTQTLSRTARPSEDLYIQAARPPLCGARRAGRMAHTDGTRPTTARVSTKQV